MVMRNSPTAYGAPARTLHWASALLVATLFGLGLYMTRLDFSEWKVRVYSWHETIGVCVFVLTVLRLAWRLYSPPPPLPPAPWIEHFAAHATHLFLYAALFVQPILGWLGSNAFGFPILWFGIVPLPDPIGKNEDLGRALLTAHSILGHAMLLAVLAHAGAALFHHFVRRDSILARMLPRAKPRGERY
jgi:cytochrome b561